MLDIGWAELLVVAVVLIVVVGPKDLPRMLRTFGKFTSQMRSMAGDFRKQFDEAIKEADLEDVRKAADDVRKLDPRREIRAAMNPMKQIGDDIRSSLKSATESTPPRVPRSDDTPVAEAPVKAATNGQAGDWNTYRPKEPTQPNSTSQAQPRPNGTDTSASEQAKKTDAVSNPEHQA